MPAVPITVPSSRSAPLNQVGLLTTVWFRFFQLIAGSPAIQLSYSGAGDPNGRVSAPPGAFYLNKSGGANVTLWIREDPVNATVWVAK